MLDFHFHLARFMARTVENNIFLEIFKKKKKKKKKRNARIILTYEASKLFLESTGNEMACGK